MYVSDVEFSYISIKKVEPRPPSKSPREVQRWEFARPTTKSSRSGLLCTVARATAAVVVGVVLLLPPPPLLTAQAADSMKKRALVVSRLLCCT